VGAIRGGFFFINCTYFHSQGRRNVGGAS
jgi:hypothetical protein